jgi:ferredoxin
VEHDPSLWNISAEDGKSCLKGALEKKGVFVLKVNSIEAQKNKKAAEDCPVRIIKIQE